MQDCCFKGFQWNGTPSGKEEKIGGNDVYITGSNDKRAILFCHDALGWKFNNARLLADQFAKEVGATVYLPDFFHGYAVPEECLKVVRVGDSSKVEVLGDFDLGKWFAANSPDVRMPEVLNVARTLREKYSWIAAVGYCWGGSVGFRLASKSNAGLIDVISIAHPGAPTEDELRQISVPFQILAPEFDPQFSQEWKDKCNAIIPTLGVEYDYLHFPGMMHGFATKCDENDEKEKKALELAKNAVVYWFAAHNK